MPKYFERDHFTYGARPSFIYGGDFNYSRCLPDNWRDRMLKMRAAGLNTISSYVIWAFHERSEGEWRFSGEADLQRFIEIAYEVGLWVILRLGPFVHAEWRNGGLPQWVVDKLGKRVRTNDPEYLRLAKLWYERVLEIVVPYLCSHGGPVIMLQAENELGSAGSKGDDIPRGSVDPQENARHVRYFLDILKDNGVDVPILDINHFPGKEKMEELITPGGIYVVSCFAKEGEFPPISLERWEQHDRPLMTIETMGGMFNRFFDWPVYSNTRSYQGPIVKPEYLERITYQHLAEGYNGIVYYVFVDGQHPDNGAERMLPEKDMNFQAPITAVGTMRQSYKTIKRIGWFLRSFQDELLKTEPSSSWMKAFSYGQAYPISKDTADLFEEYHRETENMMIYPQHITEVESMGRVTKGLNLSDSNFSFLFNVKTRGTQWKRDVRLVTSPNALACEVTAEFPRRIQLDIPPQRAECLPFYVRLDKGRFLEYSTAELLDRRAFDNGTQVILYADTDELVETSLVLPEKSDVLRSGEATCIWESPNTLMLLGIPRKDYQVSVIQGEVPLRIVLMERDLAGHVWDIASPYGDVVAASNMSILESYVDKECSRVRVQIADADIFFHMFCPSAPSVKCPMLDLAGDYDEKFHTYCANGYARLPDIQMRFSKKHEKDLWIWEADVDPQICSNLTELVLRLEYDGECGRAYFGDRLISDHYFGRFLYWEVALKDYVMKPGRLRLEFERTRNAEVKVIPLIEDWLEISWMSS